MNYEANYTTALTYMRAGLSDRALESLHKAIEAIPKGDKVKENVVYFRILTILTQIYLQNGSRADALKYIEEGLNIKDDHSDLMFLKSLCLWDEKQYDEMLELLVKYIVSFMSSETEKYEYDFTGEGALNEFYGNLLPIACQNSNCYEQILKIVEKLASKTNQEHIVHAYDVMLKTIDSKKC